MRTTLLNRIARWMLARSDRAARSDTAKPGVHGTAQTQALLLRLRDLECQVRGLTKHCSELQTAVSVHDWSLEALWEKVYESRATSAPAAPPNPGPPKKKTLN